MSTLTIDKDRLLLALGVNRLHAIALDQLVQLVDEIPWVDISMLAVEIFYSLESGIELVEVISLSLGPRWRRQSRLFQWPQPGVS